MDIQNLLEQVKAGEMEISQAEALLKKLPYEELGFAKLDHHRKARSGLEEVIFCQGKQTQHLVEIYKHFYEQDSNVLEMCIRDSSWMFCRMQKISCI